MSYFTGKLAYVTLELSFQICLTIFGLQVSLSLGINRCMRMCLAMCMCMCVQVCECWRVDCISKYIVKIIYPVMHICSAQKLAKLYNRVIYFKKSKIIRLHLFRCDGLNNTGLRMFAYIISFDNSQIYSFY